MGDGNMKTPKLNTAFWKRGDAEFYKDFLMKIVWTWSIPISIAFLSMLAMKKYMFATFYGFFIILLIMMHNSHKKYKKEMREEIK